MTHEYMRAVETYGLSYADLKQMARTSLEHTFLPGASLWREPDNFDRATATCALAVPGGGKPIRLNAPSEPSSCPAFLKSSQKAQQQWELERRFREFEATF